MCLKGRICADYLQIYLYPDSDEIHLDEFLSYGQYQLKSGIPVIIGDFDSTTKIKARVSSSVVRTNEATSFLVGMDIKASTESFGTFILYNCDMAVTRVSGISATAVDDIVNCRATGDIYGGRYIFGSTIYSNKIFNFKEIANSHIELAGDRHSTGIHLADVISSSTIIDKMGEYHDTYPTYCSADTILDSNFFITGRFLKIKTAIINSTIEYNEPLSQYDRQTVVVAEKDIIISKSSIKASCHFIVSSINYSCFGLIGVSISDGGSYSINNLSCSLTVTQNISNYYGHKYTCSAAVKGKGCITDCQIIASGNVNSVSFACSDIWYRF